MRVRFSFSALLVSLSSSPILLFSSSLSQYYLALSPSLALSQSFRALYLQQRQSLTVHETQTPLSDWTRLALLPLQRVGRVTWLHCQSACARPGDGLLKGSRAGLFVSFSLLLFLLLLGLLILFPYSAARLGIPTLHLPGIISSCDEKGIRKREIVREREREREKEREGQPRLPANGLAASGMVAPRHFLHCTSLVPIWVRPGPRDQHP
jgi:hypothetical protein